MRVCHVCVGASTDQNGKLDLPEFQAAVSFLMWVLGNELGASARAADLMTDETSLQPVFSTGMHFRAQPMRWCRLQRSASIINGPGPQTRPQAITT